MTWLSAEAEAVRFEKQETYLLFSSMLFPSLLSIFIIINQLFINSMGKLNEDLRGLPPAILLALAHISRKHPNSGHRRRDHSRSGNTRRLRVRAAVRDEAVALPSRRSR